MKVNFKYTRKLGNNKIGDVVSMFRHTAEALKAFGEITKDKVTVVKVKKKAKSEPKDISTGSGSSVTDNKLEDGKP